ncbi:MAG: tRNA (guanosine(46)-N7)-methyltransferase TrmB [Phycisphaeraceae bacterium]|nr:tRNA (guanosine(46)-N7)-methyltransferase TrmB [Phycisphaeraceae bacterium]
MSLSLSHGKPVDVGRIGITQEALPPYEQGPIDLGAWFGAGAERPLELEIGSGKGTFLVQEAAAAPDRNFIGIEYARAFWAYAADRCRRRGLDNVRLVYVEAGYFLDWFVPDGCLEVVHVYFPDPWPKKRHHKRRLIQPPLLRNLHRRLTADATIRIATDHEDYFSWIGEAAAEVTDLYDRLPFERPPSTGGDEWVGTNFERKYRREGRSFHGMVLRRRPGPDKLID